MKWSEPRRSQDLPLAELGTLEKLAIRVRRERVRQALTQPAVAAAAGVPLRTYKRFEKSGRGSVETLMRVAYALGQGNAVENLFPDFKVSAGLTLAERVERLRRRVEERSRVKV